MLKKPPASVFVLGLLATIAVVAPSRADDVDADGIHPIIAELLTAEAESDTQVAAPLWKHRDAQMQRAVDASIRRLRLEKATQSRRLAVALVDTTDPERPRVAAVNGDTMMYAASLPKIAILLAAFELAERGRLQIDQRVEESLTAMIRYSSNEEATAMMHRVGIENIARVLMSPRYRFYDPDHNGGIWVGKDYGKAGLWQRDPLHSLSHGATPLQVARFYFLLQRDELVSAAASQRMKAILAGTGIDHKFAKGLRAVDPQAALWRKSGTWGAFHADSALVARDGRSYIAVALSQDPHGGEWLSDLIVAFDEIIAARPQQIVAQRR